MLHHQHLARTSVSVAYLVVAVRDRAENQIDLRAGRQREDRRPWRLSEREPH